MIRIDLITGFLGSGKTTFIRLYAKYLTGKGLRVAILENDHGAVNVDMMLLKELEKEGCELEMIAGGCDYDCHMRRFRTKLISMAMRGFDRVIVEPSGIFDVDEFFDILHDEPLDRWYEAGSVIAICDAGLPDQLSRESEYLLVSQVSCAGALVISRTQQYGPGAVRSVLEHLSAAMKAFGCQREFAGEVCAKDWSSFTEEDFEAFMNASFVPSDHIKLQTARDNAYETLYFMNLPLSLPEIREKAECFLADETRFGFCIRVKCFHREEDGWYEINASRGSIRTAPIEEGQEVLLVIGEDLKGDAVAEALLPPASRETVWHNGSVWKC